MKVLQLGQGDDLVLLHGWASQAAVLTELAILLSAQFRVHYFDLPGYGDNCDASLETILMQLPERFHCFAWSMGGLMACEIAQRYPKKLKSLSTLAFNPKFIAEAKWPGMLAKTFFDFKQDVIANGLNRFFALQCQGSSKRKQALGVLKKFSQNPAEMSVLLDGLARLETSDARASLAALDCPQQHIYAKQDHIVPIDVAKAMREHLPNARIITLDDSNHLPFITQPTVCQTALETFLGECVETV